jgi:spermidine synthase
VETPDGRMELRQRAEGDFLITVAGRVLMNSRASRSEEVLAERAVDGLARRAAPRVLIAGIGMGLTLRAALDALPEDARVDVAELNAAVAGWCRGPLAELTGAAVADPRVSVEIADVTQVIQRAGGGSGRWDAIILDLFEGPHDGSGQHDPLYGDGALAAARAALVPGGTLAIWSEERSARFEKRLARAGFDVSGLRPGRGGRRHAAILAVARLQKP